MPTRYAEAEWKGPLKKGGGTVSIQSIGLKSAYSFGSRFEKGTGTNPEELLGAAHAACFSMALAGILEQAGFVAERILTSAHVAIELVGKDFTVTQIRLLCQAKVPRIDQEQFEKLAETARTGCPVSRALTGVSIAVVATLQQ